MLKQVIFTINLNVGYAQALITDIPDELFASQPIPGPTINHPAWVLGHMSTGNDYACVLLGKNTTVCPPTWEALFGNNSEPKSDRSLYPSKQVLFDKFAQSSQHVIQALQSTPPSALTVPLTGPLSSFFPTVGDFVLYDVTSHAGTHLGQISTWRRLKGMPRLF